MRTSSLNYLQNTFSLFAGDATDACFSCKSRHALGTTGFVFGPGKCKKYEKESGVLHENPDLGAKGH